MSAMFDADYGPYRGDPRDPRYDDSEDLAREEWEDDNSYVDRIGESAVEEILHALEHGKPEDAKRDLERRVNACWQQKKHEDHH
jgi:hypothetical protein